MAAALEDVERGRDVVRGGAGGALQLFLGAGGPAGFAEQLQQVGGQRVADDVAGGGKGAAVDGGARELADFLGAGPRPARRARAGLAAAAPATGVAGLLCAGWLLLLQMKTGASNSPNALRIASEISPSVA